VTLDYQYENTEVAIRLNYYWHCWGRGWFKSHPVHFFLLWNRGIRL